MSIGITFRGIIDWYVAINVKSFPIACFQVSVLCSRINEFIVLPICFHTFTQWILGLDQIFSHCGGSTSDCTASAAFLLATYPCNLWCDQRGWTHDLFGNSTYLQHNLVYRLPLTCCLCFSTRRTYCRSVNLYLWCRHVIIALNPCQVAHNHIKRPCAKIYYIFLYYT